MSVWIQFLDVWFVLKLRAGTYLYYDACTPCIHNNTKYAYRYILHSLSRSRRHKYNVIIPTSCFRAVSRTGPCDFSQLFVYALHEPPRGERIRCCNVEKNKIKTKRARIKWTSLRSREHSGDFVDDSRVPHRTTYRNDAWRFVAISACAWRSVCDESYEIN